MSGIVGIVHRDGCPVDRALLAGLTESMAFRGPDGRRTWVDGSVGLGCAKLATTDEARREEQPLSLDGEAWIVADARIDGRRELAAALESAGREGVRRATDAELILHAYRAWGEDAPAHLLGDFSFAIWDRPRRRLFCARDHFGVKPFYYAELGGLLVFSNTLGCVRRHPAVSSELNELAVADYLLFESNQDPETTTFADIRRLPPAHTLHASPEGRAIRRYWELPIEEAPTVEPAEGWVERFRAVFRTAVEDRLRTDRVAILMSGGLDSTSVAATAHSLYAGHSLYGGRGQGAGIRCYTLGYDRLIPDLEGQFARRVTQSLSLPFHYQPLDGYRFAERWGELPVSPEPGDPLRDAMMYDHELRVAREYRVTLTGLGGDPILEHSTGYFLEQLQQLRLVPAARYLIGSLRRAGRLPPLGLRTRWARWRRRRSWREGYPSWLDPAFEARHDLEGRWHWYSFERGPRALHPTRPDAHRSLWDVFWVNALERMDAGARGCAIEQRHPFFDLRLVELLLTVPAVPWCVDKLLLREAMRGILPEAVRTRPKTPLAGFPEHPPAEPAGRIWDGQTRRVPEIERYVRTQAIHDELRRGESDRATWRSSEIQRPMNLAYWLECARIGATRGELRQGDINVGD